jgi:hypothetical protein
MKRAGPLRLVYWVVMLVVIALLLWQIQRMVGSVEGLSKP